MSEDRTPTKIPQGRRGVEAFACPRRAVGLKLGQKLGRIGGCQKAVGQRYWVKGGGGSEAGSVGGSIVGSEAGSEVGSVVGSEAGSEVGSVVGLLWVCGWV